MSELIETSPSPFCGGTSPRPRVPVNGPRPDRPNPVERGCRGLRAPSPEGKNFVLDTNVLLHDPHSLDRFADNHVCIPVDVLAELDRFKNEQNDRGAHARAVHRRLTELFDAADPEAVTLGVPTKGGGTLRLVVFDPGSEGQEPASLREFNRLFPDRSRADHRILACALLLAHHNPRPVILVSKDLNLALKARAVGIATQDYLNDKVDADEVHQREIRVQAVDANELQRFCASGHLELEPARLGEVDQNQYLLLQAGPKQTMPARVVGGSTLVRLEVPEVVRIPGGGTLKPLNLGQQCLIDALLNPEISLITCFGQAGTGKTLLAVACALSEVFARRYNGVTVSRPVVAMGEQLGFLPGSLQEKMQPWMQPVYDALELLLRPQQAGLPSGPRRKQKAAHAQPGPEKSAHSSHNADQPGGKPWEPFVQQGIIEVEALCYIRGRSIPNRFFVLDEAQQLTPLEAKTIVTRMSRGSKLVLLGDPGQIDNPYVDSRSNGLVYTRQRMRGLPFVAHVDLAKGERSELAEAGAQRM